MDQHNQRPTPQARPAAPATDKGDFSDGEWAHVAPTALTSDEAQVVETIRQRQGQPTAFGQGGIQAGR